MHRGARTASPNSRNTNANCCCIFSVGGSHSAGMIRSRNSRRSISMLSVVRSVADLPAASFSNTSSSIPGSHAAS